MWEPIFIDEKNRRPMSGENEFAGVVTTEVAARYNRMYDSLEFGDFSRDLGESTNRGGGPREFHVESLKYRRLTGSCRENEGACRIIVCRA